MAYIGHCCYNNPKAGVRGCILFNSGHDDDVYKNPDRAHARAAGDKLSKIYKGGSTSKAAHYDCYYATMREHNRSDTTDLLKEVGKGMLIAGANKFVTDQIGKRLN